MRNRVTDTHGPYEVGEFRVLRVGAIVALHFGTPVGRIVVHVREHSFVRHARGAADDQGNPFRTVTEIERTRAQAEAEPPAPAGPPERPSRARPRPDCEAAWEYLTSHLHLPVRVIADRFGIPYGALTTWLQRNRYGELTRLRREAGLTRHPLRGPILKPGGKIL